jgi:hypothetical protein
LLQRLTFALGHAAFGMLATTTQVDAAFDPTREELVIGTFLFALGAMLLLTLIYAVKWYFGLDHQPEIDWPDSHGGSSH